MPPLPLLRFSPSIIQQRTTTAPSFKVLLRRAQQERLAGRDYLLLHSGTSCTQTTERKYHFFATKPRYAIKDHALIDFKKKISYSLAEPLQFLESSLKQSQTSAEETLKKFKALPFIGGWLGFFSYDYKNWVEKENLFTAFPFQSPKCYLVAYENVALYLEEKGTVACYSIRQKFEEKFFSALREKPLTVETAPAFYHEAPFREPAEAFKQKVRAIKEAILNGTVYQVNLSRKVTGSFYGAVEALAEALFAANPNPYEALLKFGDYYLLSTSPERFFRYQAGRLETNPIKGTAPRGVTSEAADAIKKQLLSSRKDEAELSMIVDLLRNDLNRLSVLGSVRVTRFKALLEYNNVYHLYAQIEGQSKKSPLEVLNALVPGGSISGAPKIKAAQLIEQLEGEARGTYTGALGYFSLHQKAEFSLLIRSVLFYKQKYLLRSGAGITLGSEEEEEYKETLAKTHFLETLLRKAPNP